LISFTELHSSTVVKPPQRLEQRDKSSNKIFRVLNKKLKRFFMKRRQTAVDEE